ncbi:MAG: flagellar biosynthesis protein FlhB [Firmicutes bacterium]|nr:flagellar biosynthesis protein FlhB [Bacillota bacterium]
MSEDKTEEPTQHRIQEARKKGQVAKSTDIPVVAAMLVTFMFLSSRSKEIILAIAEHMKSQIHNFTTVEISAQSLTTYLIASAMPIFQLFLPLFGLLVLVAIGTNLLQTGFLVSVESLSPKLEKLNPVEGFKRIFSQKGIIEFAKVLLKTIIMIIITKSFMEKNMEKITNLGFLPFASVFENFLEIMKSFAFQIIGCLAIIAGLDYFYQAYSFKKDMMMTKQEVKEEYKSLEGDPYLKQRLRARQREMVKRRMLEGVKGSRVVVTNPTHYAIALKYKEDDDEAPILVAKGVDHLAQQIKKLAEKHKVPIHENPPLARSLYDQVDEGQMIPPDLYMAVAEVIAFVERLENLNSGGNPFGK